MRMAVGPTDAEGSPGTEEVVRQHLGNAKHTRPQYGHSNYEGKNSLLENPGYSSGQGLGAI